MNKIYWKNLVLEAAEMGAGLAFPPAIPLIKVIKFSDKQLGKLFAKKQAIEEEGWKIICNALIDTLDAVWVSSQNPVKKTWREWETLELTELDRMADEYNLFDFTDRSFIYEIVSIIAATLYGDVVKADKQQTIEFARRIVQTWKDEIEKAARIGGNPFADLLRHEYSKKLAHEFDWADYKFYLRLLPYKTIMGRDDLNGIQAIYVRPYAHQTDTNDDENKEQKFLKEWVLQNLIYDQESKPIGIFGGPGMGKSSFCKMFAADLCETQPDVYPLLIRLRVLRQGMQTEGVETWADAIRTAPNLEDFNLTLEIDDDDIRKRKMVIILDGLDELNISGTKRENLQQLFVALERFSYTKCFNAIVTSRPLEFMGDKDRRAYMQPIFEIQLFDETARMDLIDKFKICKILPDNTDEQFIQWITKIDEHNPQERQMSGQPLLLYLLAQVFSHAYKKKIDLGKELNRTAVYESIVQFTLERAYDNEKNVLRFQNAGLKESKDARLLLQEVALALYQMGQDFAQPEQLKARLKKVRGLTNIQNALPALKDVLIAFHIGEHKETGGVEFIHKSIAEFLTAEAIVRRLDTMIKKYDLEPDPHLFAKSFIDIFGMQIIDDDLEPYLVELFAEKPELSQNLLPRLQEFIDGILNMVWLNEGYTLEISREYDQKDPLGFEIKSGIACLRLFSIIAQTKVVEKVEVCLSNIDLRDEKVRETYLKKNFWKREKDGKFNNFLNRMLGGRRYYRIVITPATGYLAGADLSGANLSGALLYRTNFSGADLSGANLGNIWFGCRSRRLSHIEAVAYIKEHFEGVKFLEKDERRYKKWRAEHPDFKWEDLENEE